MPSFATTRRSPDPQAIAPDGTAVRLLLSLAGGSFAHFELAQGKTSLAVAHRTVEEIWYFTSGRGELWRKQDGEEAVVAVEAGVCVTIPLGAAFQFRALGDQPLAFVAITMPPWPGDDEAFAAKGPWRADVARGVE
jgi:mannose-6-phosphate isomerase-like protein (cupin superfamily)